MKPHPPKWADRFLEWYCNPYLLEEIQGDVHELYQRQMGLGKKRKADFQFIWAVLRFFRWSNIRRTQTRFYYNPTAMLKNYLLTGFRNAIRHKLNTSINMIGLTLAIGCAITVFLFIDNQLHADNFYSRLNDIYQVTNTIESDGRSQDWGDSPYLLAPALTLDNSEIEAATRIEYTDGSIRYNEKVFNEWIWFVDQSFLTVFTFPLLEGNTAALNNKSQIILVRQTAEKYFGKTNPVGQTLSIKFQNNRKEEFVVGAVIDRPENSSIYPKVLISMDVFEDLKLVDNLDWSYMTDATFILLKPEHSIGALTDRMEKYKTLQNAASPKWLIEDFKFHPLKGLPQKSHDIVSSVSNGAHPSGLFALGVVAGLLLVLACFNYMNVSIATVATRLKEIGIRKVIGGRKREVIIQFLTENFLLCGFAMGAGALVSYLLLLPGFNSLYPMEVPFSFSSGNAMFLFFGGLLLFIGLASGAYPAFYISSFTPIGIMRGREKFGQRSLLSRILLTFQFILAFMTIVGSFIFIDNSLYLKHKDWGYNHSNTLVVPVPDKSVYLALRDRVVRQKEIISTAGSSNHIGYANTRSSFDHLEQRYEIVVYGVGFDYLETMNIRLKTGRFFDRNIQTDKTESVIINEAFAQKLSWEKPVGESFVYDSTKYYVIGVVEDFHYDGFYDPKGPVMFRITPQENFKYLSIQVQPGELAATEAYVKTAWSEVAPDDPYDGFFQDEVFADFNNDNNANVKILGFVSTMAVLLASLGLFGLVSFNITRRLKEFSIRKVFGANIPHIFRLMNRDYIWILMIAFLVGAPLGFIMINALIQQIYPEPHAAGPLPFTIAIIIMMVTVGLTIGSQLRRVAKESPSNTLRND